MREAPLARAVADECLRDVRPGHDEDLGTELARELEVGLEPLPVRVGEEGA